LKEKVFFIFENRVWQTRR